jgi:hypothetical protein
VNAPTTLTVNKKGHDAFFTNVLDNVTDGGPPLMMRSASVAWWGSISRAVSNRPAQYNGIGRCVCDGDSYTLEEVGDAGGSDRGSSPRLGMAYSRQFPE